MKSFATFFSFLLIAGIITSIEAIAGPPFNNLEGVGGIAFNPLAYLADSDGDNRINIRTSDVLGKPRFGAFYVNLNDAAGGKGIDWTTIGIADSFFKRVEVSYGYESIAIGGAANVHKNSVGAKVLALPENSFSNKLIPAISVGGIYKSTTYKAAKDDADIDFYAVATKLFTQLPRPVLLSAGVLSTKDYVTGVLGFDDKRKVTPFGNVDVIVKNVALGFEYKKGAEFANFKNADYWDAHAALLASKNLTVIAAYVNAGDKDSTEKVGFGNGVVVSTQYAF